MSIRNSLYSIMEVYRVCARTLALTMNNCITTHRMEYWHLFKILRTNKQVHLMKESSLIA